MAASGDERVFEMLDHDIRTSELLKAQRLKAQRLGFPVIASPGLFLSPRVEQQTRYALLIGGHDKKDPDRFNNDIKKLGDVLEGTDIETDVERWQVTKHIRASVRELKASIVGIAKRMNDDVKKGLDSVFFFHYSGHGNTVQGNVQLDLDAPYSVGNLIDTLKRTIPSQLRIISLDCCRVEDDNTPSTVTLGDNAYVVWSCAPNATAGELSNDKYGRYTNILLGRLVSDKAVGAHYIDTFARVRHTMKANFPKQSIHWCGGSTVDFCFVNKTLYTGKAEGKVPLKANVPSKKPSGYVPVESKAPVKEDPVLALSTQLSKVSLSTSQQSVYVLETVYDRNKGGAYHLKKCHLVKGAETCELTREQARSRGFRNCGMCNAPG